MVPVQFYTRRNCAHSRVIFDAISNEFAIYFCVTIERNGWVSRMCVTVAYEYDGWASWMCLTMARNGWAP